MQGYIAATIPAALDWSGCNSFVIFFGGCDFRCRYCYVPEYLDFKNEYLTDLKEVKREIRNSAEMVDKVLFTGGEPCLQRQAVIDLARHCKRQGLQVTLDTNGTRTDTISHLIANQLVDNIIMDLKIPFQERQFERLTLSRTFFKDTGEIMGNIRETLELLHHNQDRLNIEFKTVVVPSFVFKKEDLLQLAEVVKDFNCRWTLQQFEPDSERNLADKNLANISPPTKRFLENLKTTCQKRFPSLRIDVRSS